MKNYLKATLLVWILYCVYNSIMGSIATKQLFLTASVDVNMFILMGAYALAWGIFWPPPGGEGNQREMGVLTEALQKQVEFIRTCIETIKCTQPGSESYERALLGLKEARQDLNDYGYRIKDLGIEGGLSGLKELGEAYIKFSDEISHMGASQA